MVANSTGMLVGLALFARVGFLPPGLHESYAATGRLVPSVIAGAMIAALALQGAILGLRQGSVLCRALPPGPGRWTAASAVGAGRVRAFGIAARGLAGDADKPPVDSRGESGGQAGAGDGVLLPGGRPRLQRFVALLCLAATLAAAPSTNAPDVAVVIPRSVLERNHCNELRLAYMFEASGEAAAAAYFYGRASVYQDLIDFIDRAQ